MHDLNADGDTADTVFGVPETSATYVALAATELGGGVVVSKMSGANHYQLSRAGLPVCLAPGVQGTSGTVSEGACAPVVLNLVQNSLFEGGTTSWTPRLSAFPHSVSSVRAVYGTSSVRMEQTSGGQDTFLQQTMTVVPGQVYTVLAHVYVESLTSGALGDRGLFVTDADHSGNIAVTTLNPSTPQAQWVRHSVTFTPSGTSLQLRLYAPAGMVHWDAVQVETGSTVSPYTP